jgi:hypothetical protein
MQCREPFVLFLDFDDAYYCIFQAWFDDIHGLAWRGGSIRWLLCEHDWPSERIQWYELHLICDTISHMQKLRLHSTVVATLQWCVFITLE